MNKEIAVAVELLAAEKGALSEQDMHKVWSSLPATTKRNETLAKIFAQKFGELKEIGEGLLIVPRRHLGAGEVVERLFAGSRVVPRLALFVSFEHIVEDGFGLLPVAPPGVDAPLDSMEERVVGVPFA